MTAIASHHRFCLHAGQRQRAPFVLLRALHAQTCNAFSSARHKIYAALVEQRAHRRVSQKQASLLRAACGAAA